MWLRGGTLKHKVSSSNTPSIDKLTEENTVAVQSVILHYTKEQGGGDKTKTKI
jgi:hypothetical protein